MNLVAHDHGAEDRGLADLPRTFQVPVLRIEHPDGAGLREEEHLAVQAWHRNRAAGDARHGLDVLAPTHRAVPGGADDHTVTITDDVVTGGTVPDGSGNRVDSTFALDEDLVGTRHIKGDVLGAVHHERPAVEALSRKGQLPLIGKRTLNCKRRLPRDRLVVGDVGDGHVHVWWSRLYLPWQHHANRLLEGVVESFECLGVLSLGGQVTGVEHGVVLLPRLRDLLVEDPANLARRIVVEDLLIVIERALELEASEGRMGQLQEAVVLSEDALAFRL